MHLVSRVAVAAALLVAVPATAAAGPPSSPASSGKDPDAAMALSAGVTFGSLVVLLAAATIDDDATAAGFALAGTSGLYLGPSTGHWYAGEVGTAGLVLRALAAVAVLEGLDLRGPFDCPGFDPGDGCDEDQARWQRDRRVGTGLLLAGLGLWVGSTTWDLVTAPRAARRWNAAHAVTVAPVVMATARGPAPGLTLGGRF